MDKDIYQKSLNKQKRKGTPSLCCVICGEDDPEVIEMHHIFGRNNSDQIQPLCKNCHSKVTGEQNKLSPKARSGTASPEQKTAFQLVSIGALLKELGTRLIDIGNEMVLNG
ncbi:HNH endonuclease [Methanosarcina sp. DH2]|uniref:HNH endonuclease signature motif containing protein n=1 Tax=Methanosarcina sp. DH2 TaxID=2605639 RepID=UPI001E571FEB|nr:HNH endonuclease signature motif containing protein [Methanosarcina sp. DH2]MCC4771838.1 HNH endonuclease [Methanosarcina sp. DH2]